MEDGSYITTIHISTSIPAHDNRRQDGEYIWVVEALLKREYTESTAHTKEGTGFERATTKNRLALLALDEAMQSLKAEVGATVYTDNPNIMFPIREGWIYRWAADGWNRSQVKAGHKYLLRLENADLWQRIYHLLPDHPLTWAENEKSTYRDYMRNYLRQNRRKIETEHYMAKMEGTVI